MDSLNRTVCRQHVINIKLLLSYCPKNNILKINWLKLLGNWTHNLLNVKKRRSTIRPLQMLTLCLTKKIIQDQLTNIKKPSHRSEEHTSELQSRPHLVC